MRRLFRLWRLSRQDVRVLWAALRHPNRPSWLIPVSLGLGLFALDPLNFAIPVLGVVDDLVLLPLLLHALATLAVRATGLASVGASAVRSRDDRVVSVQ